MSCPDPIRCLIVDDVAENLVALEALLKTEGVEVLTARSGPEALELLLKHEVALALLDVHMPDMDGFELAELMRGIERSRHVPIIFVTAASREAHRVFRGYETGAVDFLFKPIDPNILRHKADTFFSLYRRKQELARAVRVRDDVLAVVSHDLRDPLNVVAMAGSILEQLGNARQDRQTLEIAGMLQRSVDRMQRMISDLLDMATLRSGRLSISPQHCDVDGLLREAVAAQEPAAVARSMQLSAGTAPGTSAVFCDRQRMLQVFSNLVGNAIKFCPAGARIQVFAEADAGGVRFHVEDTGPGISSEDLPHLFDPYWSAERDRHNGNGLGLYITKGIVEAHGGRIWAENRESGGAAMRFVLPAR
jgi:two-component system, sensor histidine kinase and response regulator